jgi:LacI family transcriptional regulator
LKKSDIKSIEIAKLAGVSRSTVSRVINNYSNVPIKTREKVMKVIQQYDYFPNVSAQVLAGKKTRTIGLFLIEAGDSVSSDILTNMLIVSVIEHASSYGYYVLTHIIRDANDLVTIKNVKEIFYQRRIEGGIFIGSASKEPFIEKLIAEGFIVGVVDQEKDHMQPNRIISNFDNYSGMKQAVDYLSNLGHTQIGVINGDLNRLSGQTKYEGFLKAMDSCGLHVNQDWVLAGDFNEVSGYHAIHSLLLKKGERPTAIIAANDSVAFGAIRALKENGLQVPVDMSIIGFDDHPLSEKHHPALTTIQVEFSDMLKQLTAILIGKIEQDSFDFSQITVDCKLVVRDSCTKIL